MGWEMLSNARLAQIHLKGTPLAHHTFLCTTSPQSCVLGCVEPAGLMSGVLQHMH